MRTLCFCPVVSSSSSIFLSFFSSPNSVVADWISAIRPHMHVWPYCEFKMQVWNVLHAARSKYRTQKSRQKSPSGHHRPTLSGYIFAIKARFDNGKNLVSSNIFYTCSHNMVNLGPLAAEIGPVEFGGIPYNFNGLRLLAALLCTVLQ